ncbi:F-box protein At5g52880 isoform X2 [Neltuma alba]|nr:F-box protein At5g52880 isoform X2 [Prosopis alba]XP_028798799.1 F-box protein At5g52880 isoform X2 [Prosopis alba]XP_028798800.1 F-box protein At5g52880 isoform X2 [Prosopis alba]XP_028798801.1 F-box protein At5g52880 isoform X2 [Prosopis alba]
MSNPFVRYRKLRLREFLPKIYRYPIACKELSSILRDAYNKLPKNLQAIIFEDILTAFRLLPEIQTQSGVSSAHVLVQSVEVALPKQKRNMAVKEFKHAIVAHKRRCKAQREGQGSTQLPHDILVHIFSLLDVKSLVSVGLVCWSWNLAANENHLWELHYAVLYGSFVQEQPIRLDGDKKYPLSQDPIDTKLNIDWKEAVRRQYTGALLKKLTSNRGYCAHCKTVVWLNNSKCLNAHCEIMSNIQDIKPVTACQVAEYLLDDSLSMTSSSDSDSDSEGGSVSRLWAYAKHFKR